MDALPEKLDFVAGDRTGHVIPAHPDALRAAGVDFLNRAFLAFRALAPDNRVTRIVACETCPGGSTGQKLFLSVEYRRAEPGLHRELFVKFSRDFTDAGRDARGKYEMEGEARFAALSRLDGFPIAVPKVYFSDYHHESHTGLIISERVAFGVGGIEQQHHKCLDHELEDTVAYYRVILSSLARIAAAHRAGRLAADIAEQFPFDPEKAAAADPIPYDAARMAGYVRRYAEFAESCPQLLPAPLRAPEFIAKLTRQVPEFLAREAAVKRFLQSDTELIALCHWNANIDNAWFWREDGALKCGLMDWGHVGQMNLAFSLWGALSAAGHEVWAHFDELLDWFIAELARHGGPALQPEKLKLHLDLYIAMMVLSFLLPAPGRLLQRFPQIAKASGPLDPAVLSIETARNQLHILTVALNRWNSPDFRPSFERMLSLG